MVVNIYSRLLVNVNRLSSLLLNPKAKLVVYGVSVLLVSLFHNWGGG